MAGLEVACHYDRARRTAAEARWLLDALRAGLRAVAADPTMTIDAWPLLDASARRRLAIEIDSGAHAPSGEIGEPRSAAPAAPAALGVLVASDATATSGAPGAWGAPAVLGALAAPRAPDAADATDATEAAIALHEHVAQQARRTPDDVAATFADRTLTYLSLIHI